MPIFKASDRDMEHGTHKKEEMEIQRKENRSRNDEPYGCEKLFREGISWDSRSTPISMH